MTGGAELPGVSPAAVVMVLRVPIDSTSVAAAPAPRVASSHTWPPAFSAVRPTSAGADPKVDVPGETAAAPAGWTPEGVWPGGSFSMPMPDADAMNEAVPMHRAPSSSSWLTAFSVVRPTSAGADSTVDVPGVTTAVPAG